MTDAKPRLSALSPDELERLARSHVEGMWGELRAAGAELRASVHPVNVVRRHPLAAAGAAAALVGFLLHRRRRSSVAPPVAAGAAGESLGRRFTRSLLSNLASAAGRVVPALAAGWLARWTASREEPPESR
ncbi:MAG TPA: hypothetical protein VNE39_23770 [Planctomycetota bacterium]|nr:hypothetical protein [Planctomycetota bacterium]